MERELNSMADINKSDIKWQANEMNIYNDGEITDYYIENDYGRKSRWCLWKLCIDIMEKYKIKNVFDIGAGNGHFIYLCTLHKIDAYGIEPRKDLVDYANTKYYNKCRIENNIYQNVEIPKVDCVTILNFFHGSGHIKADIEILINKIEKSTKYLITSEPRWEELELENIFKKYTKLILNLDWENKHHLWQI